MMLRPETTLRVLPQDEGTFVVETAQSAYLIDTNQKTAERWPAAPGAPALRHDGQPIAYWAIHCVLGEPLLITYAPTSEAPGGFKREASTVESITTAWPSGWPWT